MLQAGRTRYFVFHLNYYFGERDNRDIAHHTRYLPEGTYKLKIIHNTNPNFLFEYHTGKYPFDPKLPFPYFVDPYVDRMEKVSNEVTFTVVTPEGEQIQEWEDYMFTMQQYVLQVALEKDRGQAYEYLRDFYNEYPNSPYITRILRKATFILYKDRIGESFLSKEETFDKIKNSYYSFLVSRSVKALYPDLKGDRRRYTPNIAALERAAIKYQGTALGRYCESEAMDRQIILDRLNEKGFEEPQNRTTSQ